MRSKTKLPPNLRDILIRPITRSVVLVISCDSSGSVGPKKDDVIKVDGEILGKFIVRTALMEVMAVGATPIGVACGLGVELKPTGERIIEGALSEMGKVGLDRSNLVISTEKNFETTQTGIGIAAFGIAKRDKLKMGMAKNGDLIVSLGVPSVGMEVLENEKRGLIADLDDLTKLLSLDFVHALIPVGSRGILHEMNILASESEASLRLNQDLGVDIRKSAGPSTVILAAVEKDRLNELRSRFQKPINVLARLEKRGHKPHF